MMKTGVQNATTQFEEDYGGVLCVEVIEEYRSLHHHFQLQRCLVPWPAQDEIMKIIQVLIGVD
jgi:hypothetical protein